MRWLFASPVAYPVQLLDGWQRWAYALNPVVGVLSLLRWTLLGGPGPRADLWVSAVLGLLWFQRTERTFADVV